MTPISLKTRRISLRPMLNDDIDVFFQWMSEKNNHYMWWTDRQLFSYQHFVEDFHHRNRSFFGQFFTVESLEPDSELESSIIGLTYTYKVNYIDRFAYICIYLIPEETKQGLGYDVGYTFINYLFSTFGFRKIYSEIFQFNEPSIKISKRSGFVKEGTLREHHWFQDRYWDLLTFSLTRENFNQLAKPE